MNFKEFEQLINSGAEEINLTEDVILEDFEEEDFELPPTFKKLGILD